MGEQLRRDFEPTEMHWTYERLKEAIVTACGHETFLPGVVSFDQLPETVDVGKFGEKAKACVEQTDRDNRERGLGVEFLPVDKKLLFEKNLIVGDEGQVNIGYPKSTHELIRRQMVKLPAAKQMLADQLMVRLDANPLPQDQAEQRLAAIYQDDSLDGRVLRDILTARVANVHSHNHPTPISLTDFGTLLSTPELRIMVVGRRDGIVEMAIKSNETNLFDKTDAKEKMKSWAEMLHPRVEEGVLKHGLSEMEANQRAQRALARSIAKKYKFGYYVGQGETLKRVE